jgi:hypothetical protein
MKIGFHDELSVNFQSKDMQSFWKTWSSKTSKKRINTVSVDGKVGDDAIADIFRDKFSVSSDNIRCSDLSNLMFYDDCNVDLWKFSVEDMNSVIRDLT